MDRFVNRAAELADLNALLAQEGAHFVLVYGRRRIGKTTLLTTWAKQTGLPTLYWVAKRDPKEALMASLGEAIWLWEHPGVSEAPVDLRPRSWESLFNMLAQAIGDRRAIVILDELPYAVQQDRGIASHLQAAWDHLFKDSNVLLFIAGSHIGIMADLITYQSPLYGRLTAQFPLAPFSFRSIHYLLPNYDVHKRLAVYAMLGGVPAYLERWNDQESILSNIERLFLQRTGWFRTEPMVIISDLTQRETSNYEAVLKAIAAGNHTREDIAATTAIPTTALSHYLPRLIELGLIERRIPATVPLPKRRTSKLSRYYLADQYLRFYYRLLDPNLHLIEQGLIPRLREKIERNFRAFVAEAFEDLCRTWVLRQAQAGNLPFHPDVVGSHWSQEAQIDVVAINWEAKAMLLGESKWGEGSVERKVIRELVAKTESVVPDGGSGWQVYYAFFARQGFTEAAVQEARKISASLLTLHQMAPDL
jgi:AAA+ ATPase superfamily predicted ATPase